MKNVTENKKLDIPEGCERVAIQLTTPNHYCHNTTHLVGSMEVSFRHLKKLGYRLVIVRIDYYYYLMMMNLVSFLFYLPYYELSAIDSSAARYRYLNNKLFKNN
jgi:hypothetical protein